jgi:hypothetical protein
MAVLLPDIVNLVSGAVEASVDARGHKPETGYAAATDADEDAASP